MQLDDTSAPDGTVAPGVLSLIAQATCLTVDGAQRCVTVDELRAAMSGTDPAQLGVPSWALADVAKADPRRRLEGLLVPGRYDVHPGLPAVDVLRGLLETSATRLEASGLVAGAQSIGSTPYQVLTISSLVEKEAITPDMAKVARVIYNRLGAGRRLELDSMVNYPLDLQALRTTEATGPRPGPYNSYQVAGLPPTPISAPGREAIAAALAPGAGPVAVLRALPDRRHLVLRRDVRRARRQRRAGQGERRLLTGGRRPSAQPRCSARKASVRCQASSAGSAR